MKFSKHWRETLTCFTVQSSCTGNSHSPVFRDLHCVQPYCLTGAPLKALVDGCFEHAILARGMFCGCPTDSSSLEVASMSNGVGCGEESIQI